MNIHTTFKILRKLLKKQKHKQTKTTKNAKKQQKLYRTKHINSYKRTQAHIDNTNKFYRMNIHATLKIFTKIPPKPQNKKEKKEP